MKKYIIGIVLSVLLAPCFAQAEQGMAVSVAVVPFESFSGEGKTAVGRDVAVKLLQKMSGNPLIITPDVQSLKEVVDQDDGGAPTEERLREVAQKLKVNFLLFGSVTTVQDATSIDAQVFYNFPGDNYFKTFAEGPDVDTAVATLAGKIEQELLDKAAGIPADQRPKVRLRQVPLAARPDAADYEKAVDRELAAEQAAVADEATALQIQAVESSEPVGLEDLAGLEMPDTAEPARVEKTEKQAVQGDGKKGMVSLKLQQPVNISADSMDFSNKDNSAVFRGNVVARQGDIVMFAEQMEATYGGKTGQKNEKGGIKQLIATGNVKIIQGERIATGQRIVFYGEEQKIVATGNPRVWQGDNVIVGKKITVYLKQDRSVVEGSTQDRVSATIYPKQKKSISK